MSDSASAPGYGLRTYPLKKRIAPLEAELREVQKQAQAQRSPTKTNNFILMQRTNTKLFNSYCPRLLRSPAMSRCGGIPNNFLYSRLKYDGSS